MWEDYKKYKQFERKAENHLRIYRKEILEQLTQGYVKLRKNLDPDLKNFYGIDTTSSLKKVAKTDLDGGALEQGEVFVDENGDVVGMEAAEGSLNPDDPAAKKQAQSVSDQRTEDLKQQVSDMIGKVKLGGTIFDYAFHQLYFEDNPDVIQSLKLKTLLSFCIQLIVIKVVFDTELANLTELIHYGDFS